jgi:hypothetical protein
MDNPHITSNGDKRWFDSNGKVHRVDGPAVIRADGYKSWYQHGVRHRVDGPAIEWPDGYNEWYLHNKCLTFDEWIDKVDISDEDKVFMKLKYG